MTLVKTSLLSLLSTATKMLAGLVISKALAVFVGPTGLAIVGQFQNFTQLLMTAAKGAIDTGVTKYTAEYGSDTERQARLFSTALRISLATSLTTGLMLVVAAAPLAHLFLHDTSFAYVMVLFGITIGLFVLNNLLLCILQGLQEVRSYIFINIVQSLVNLALTTVMVALYGLDGALVALVVNQSLVLVVVLWKLRRHPIVRPANFRRAFDREEAKGLGRYALMSIVSAIAAPLTTMLVRDHLARRLGLEAAGHWQAAWYISSVYLTVVTTSLALYYLPKLSATQNNDQVRAELKGGYLIIMPVVALMAFCIYAGRELVVKMLFTEAFTPMLPLFAWMLVGDVVKLASWLFSYLMLARAMTRAFIATEVLFSASFVLLTMVLTARHGLQGVMMAHTLNYLLYLAAVVIVTRPFWRRKTAA
jgi:O-antigen/teichoic acid export membrane protein